MATTSHKIEHTLVIEGREAVGHEVSATVLASAISALQRLVWLLVAAREGRAEGQRFKPSDELRAAYELRVALPRPGSFAVPCAVVDARPQPRLPYDESNALLTETIAAIEASGRGEREALVRVLPSAGWRARFLKTIESDLLPKPGSCYQVRLVGDGHDVHLTPRDRAHLRELLDDAITAEAAEEQRVITGRLIRIDFEANALTLRYAPTGTELACFYQPELEEELLEARHDLVQVTGVCTLDRDGHPRRLSRVSRVAPLDLSEIILSSVDIGGVEYEIDPPIRLVPELDESEQLLVVSDEDTAIEMCAESREELIEVIEHVLADHWREIVLADDARLTRRARELKHRLVHRIRKKSRAA